MKLFDSDILAWINVSLICDNNFSKDWIISWLKRKRRHEITTKFIMIITYEGPQVLYNLVCDSLVKKRSRVTEKKNSTAIVTFRV